MLQKICRARWPVVVASAALRRYFRGAGVSMHSSRTIAYRAERELDFRGFFSGVSKFRSRLGAAETHAFIGDFFAFDKAEYL